MDYGIAEEEIAQRINDQFAEMNLSNKFFAAPMPETEADAKAFEAQIQKARCAVEFIDSNFEPTSGLGAVRQMETVKFRLLFDARKMRGEFGCFRMIQHVKKFLVGHQVTNGDPLTISAYGKMQFEGGVWFPYLDVECKTLHVQQLPFEETVLGGPFKEILNGKIPEQFGQEFENTLS